MGFLNPAALLLSSLVAILIALYFWEQQRRRVDVPSLLLWESIPEAVVRTSHFRPDLLFFLQLLLLSFLILGFARPYLSANVAVPMGARHIFVLDTSASMQTREEGGSRFDQARDLLLQEISMLSAADEVMLISAASYPRVVVPFTDDHQELVAQVRALRPVDTGTHLGPAVALARRAAARTERPSRIQLFTDIERSHLAPEWRKGVEVLQVGRTDDNLALDGLEIFQGRFQEPREASARATVHNYSRRDKHGFLSIRLDDEIVSRRGFSLAPGVTRSFPVRNFPRSGVVHAVLEVDDALTVDNHAYGWIRPRGSIDLAVVTERPSLRHDLERIARSIPHLDFHFLPPSEYRRQTAGRADAILFDEYVPTEDPMHPSLYIYPKNSSSWFSVTGISEHELPVLNWNDGHPAIGKLRPQLVFPFSDTRIVQLPDWVEVLLSSNWRGQEVPLAFAAERGRRRLAGLSFDLGEERLLSADNLNLLLLFLNLLDWLLPPDSQVVIRQTGEVHTLESSSRATHRIVDPAERSLTFRPGELLRIELLHAGEYAVEGDHEVQRLFANFVDPIESDIGRSGSVRETAQPAGEAMTLPAKTFLDRWLYVLAAMLFIAEWLVAVMTR